MPEIGSKIPDVSVMTMTPDGPAERGSLELLGSGTVVLFGLPGAFTPNCNDTHLPGFVLRADELRAKGVDAVACVSVNDAFVLNGWARSLEVGDAVDMVADPMAEFAQAMGLTFDAAIFGGTRSLRYAAILRDGVIEWIQVEASPADVELSSAEAVLAAL
ncbi:MAG: peroxiredoxin [Pseudonocardia sp.]